MNNRLIDLAHYLAQRLLCVQNTRLEVNQPEWPLESKFLEETTDALQDILQTCGLPRSLPSAMAVKLAHRRTQGHAVETRVRPRGEEGGFPVVIAFRVRMIPGIRGRWSCR